MATSFTWPPPSHGHLLHMATSFLKVSNFSSHRVKFVRGMTEEMQQIIDKSRIVLDQVPAPPAMILDVVRPSRDQIQEELRRCHKQLPPDESGEDTSQDATSQLGKAYLNEDVFLKQRVTIWPTTKMVKANRGPPSSIPSTLFSNGAESIQWRCAS